MPREVNSVRDSHMGHLSLFAVDWFLHHVDNKSRYPINQKLLPNLQLRVTNCKVM